MRLHTNEIEFKHHGAVTLLSIQGDITSFSEPFLNKAYQSANDQGARKILLKVDQDAYINSGGIAVLIQILAQTKRNNQKIMITGVSNHYKKIFSMVGISKFAKIQDSVESALDVMGQQDWYIKPYFRMNKKQTLIAYPLSSRLPKIPIWYPNEFFFTIKFPTTWIVYENKNVNLCIILAVKIWI